MCLCDSLSFTRTCDLGPLASYLFLRRLGFCWRWITVYGLCLEEAKGVESLSSMTAELRHSLAGSQGWEDKVGMLGHSLRPLTVRTMMGIIVAMVSNRSDYVSLQPGCPQRGHPQLGPEHRDPLSLSDHFAPYATSAPLWRGLPGEVSPGCCWPGPAGLSP